MNRGYNAGFRAIKQQIIPSMLAVGIPVHEVDVERFTFDLLNRTCPGWMK